ncbi:hypothetical protein [Spirillospora sp. NPDC047279]|uniref:DUF6933 domain-containing protein n=1 Tax=Spirillospora sp. NPDC047279 TaxID=3155478 RepID=UPI0033D0D3A0
MLIVRATRKLLNRTGPPDLGADEQSDTRLGQWYATALFWRPQVALFVNEETLLPILLPLAPAATLLNRVPDHIASALAEYGASQALIDDETQRMRESRLAKTANRSVTGTLTDFARLAEHYRDGDPDLSALATRLAHVPCGPLYKSHTFPDREFTALIESLG